VLLILLGGMGYWYNQNIQTSISSLEKTIKHYARVSMSGEIIGLEQRVVKEQKKEAKSISQMLRCRPELARR
jgi:hypothetical protein